MLERPDVVVTGTDVVVPLGNVVRVVVRVERTLRSGDAGYVGVLTAVDGLERARRPGRQGKGTKMNTSERAEKERTYVDGRGDSPSVRRGAGNAAIEGGHVEVAVEREKSQLDGMDGEEGEVTYAVPAFASQNQAQIQTEPLHLGIKAGTSNVVTFCFTHSSCTEKMASCGRRSVRGRTGE